MLQIRLKKVTPSEGGGVVKPLPVETVTVACPDHLVLANLPVAKGIGSATTSSIVKIVGRRSRRQLGERVHFCVRCDFPIAIYGRLNPCEHVFCLDCARSDSVCYLCDERVQKIQTIKLMEGIFICAAPHCLKSFLKRNEFESHIHTSHNNLLNPNAEKEDGNESECQSTKQPTASDSSVRAPPRPVFSPGSNPPLNNRDDKTRRQQPPPRAIVQPKPPPIFGQVQNYQSDPQSDSNIPPGFAQGTPQLESSQQQQGLAPETQFPEYPPLNSVQPPNFAVPMNSNPVFPPPFGALPFPADASQQFYGGAPYGMMPRPDSLPEIGSEQASLLGFPPGTPGSGNYPPGYPQLWNAGPGGVPFEVQSGGHGIGPEGFANPYGQNPGGLPMISPPPSLAGNKAMETVQGSNNAIDLRDGKGILAPQPMSLPPPPPPGPPPHSHLTQHKRGNYYTSDMGREGQGFGWSHDSRDSYGSSQE